MRVDALASAAGVATTTIRLYRQRGLLPPPRLVGRTGHYAEEHLERLRLIARLQERGFSLAGIKELIEAAERGGQLDDLVEVETRLNAILEGPEPLVLEPAELVDRFDGVDLTPTAMARAVQLGLIEGTDDGRLKVPDRRFIDTGAALVALGVPIDEVLDEWETLRDHTDDIARRFLAVFERDVLGADWREHIDSSLAARASETLPQLLRLAHDVLDAALDASLAAQASAQLTELAQPISIDKTSTL
jgi:DNA-binding transcriptional MerR regulator